MNFERQKQLTRIRALYNARETAKLDGKMELTENLKHTNGWRDAKNELLEVQATVADAREKKRIAQKALAETILVLRSAQAVEAAAKNVLAASRAKKKTPRLLSEDDWMRDAALARLLAEAGYGIGAQLVLPGRGVRRIHTVSRLLDGRGRLKPISTKAKNLGRLTRYTPWKPSFEQDPGLAD